MKALVIGSTGLTGKILVRKLLEDGHDVTAFARDPALVAQTNPRLRVVQGEARDGASFERATQGQEVVLVAFRPRSSKADGLAEALMRHLIAAMRKDDVRRLINVSAASLGEALDQMPFLFRKVFHPLFLKHITADKARAEALMFASGLDYVNVRPGRLLNGAARGGVKAALDAQGLSLVMTREDLATFMIAQMSDTRWVGASPIVGY